jgi:hypothetical protein
MSHYEVLVKHGVTDIDHLQIVQDEKITIISTEALIRMNIVLY